MLAAERQRKILQEVKNKRAVKIFELSQLFNVSEMTIRRDLEKLDSEGLLQRAYGGALAIEKMVLEPTFQEKDSVNVEEKQIIGIAAASMINEGDTVFLSTGTTTMQIIKNLVNKKNITVMTNSLNNAFELSRLSGIRLLVVGGELRERSYAVVGPWTKQNLQGLYVDKLFLGVNGFSIKHGLTTPNLEEAEICQLMIKIAREVIVVADHSKFESVAFAQIADIDCVNRLITDSGADKEFVKKLQDKDIEVFIT